MTGPLAHIRVLDLSRVVAGPWATQALADLGADVIKVERPDVGDDTRGWGPPFLKDQSGAETRESGYFLAVNRGKRSITIDLATPDGQAVVRALAARSDIVFENFKVGTLARYGLDYPSLRAVNPALIYCSITGFGQSGPRRGQAAYDFMIQAMCGLMSVTGEPDEKPSGGPEKVGVPIVDLMTGLYATTAVLAALAHRTETGRGDYIDLAMLDVGASLLTNQAMNYLVTGKTPTRTGNAHPNIQPQNVFATRDGYLVLAVGNDAQFVKFCAAVERPDLATDERFVTNQARARNGGELARIVAETLAQADLEFWLARFSAAGVPSGPINTIPMVFADAQTQHRAMLTNIPHPLSGTVPQVVSPMRFAESTLTFDRPPPLLGQHTAEVLHELGIP